MRKEMNKTDKIYVAGHRGLVGSAIVRNLQEKGYTNIIGRTHKELDLTNQAAVREFFETEKPDVKTQIRFLSSSLSLEAIPNSHLLFWLHMQERQYV